jgi:hypothetical protein
MDMLEAVDNILDMHYFDEVLPALEGRGLHFFYEVKSNLTRRQVEQLARSGVYRIQPGIESMSDHVLKLMRKGTTALRNVQLLKWCREYGVAVDYNILYGFPGETADDYQQMLDLLRSIAFLGGPSATGPVRGMDGVRGEVEGPGCVARFVEGPRSGRTLVAAICRAKTGTRVKGLVLEPVGGATSTSFGGISPATT